MVGEEEEEEEEEKKRSKGMRAATAWASRWCFDDFFGCFPLAFRFFDTAKRKEFDISKLQEENVINIFSSAINPTGSEESDPPVPPLNADYI